MGVNHSRQDLQISDSEDEEEQDQEEEEDESAKRVSSSSASALLNNKGSLSSIGSPSLDELDARLKSLKLKYSNNNNNKSNKAPPVDQAVKLYFYAGGNTPKAKWITAEKLTTYSFLKKRIGSTLELEDDDDNDDEEEEEEEEEAKGGALKEWILKVGTKVRARVGASLQMQFFDNQKRVDFVSGCGVWAMKFSTQEHCRDFVAEYQNCSFENLYGLEATDENKVKVFGKDFIGWVKPEAADDSLWEDAEETFERALASPTVRHGQDLTEVFEEAATGGIQSLALGALENSFLVSDSGIEVVKNFSDGIHGKGVAVRFNANSNRSNLGVESSFTTPKKALLMRAETNMLLMSPFSVENPHSTGLHQLDIETGKVVTEWKFGKDGADVKMRDITNDSKGSQLDPSESTFLGLDDNALCRWDMRDQKGVVQQLATPVLHWDKGHQFSRGTNFQCFATAGDGSIVVGSLDGKIRLYSTTSMRMAKTSFPGLGSPITHVDVTYDGKWILGTTDTYLILICTLFTDKDGKTKTGFTGRMGNKIAAPRLLKLTPLHSHLAGKNSKFHRGQFSWVTENGKQERHIVGTVGKFSVIWNFQQVKKSGHECYQEQEGLKSCYCYKVVPKDESIVESSFMHDKFAITNSPEAPLVVATPMKVSSFSISSSSSAAAARR